MQTFLTRLSFVPICLILLLANCRNETVMDPPEPPGPAGPPPGTTPIEASVQRPGDAAAGYDYLVYGDYLGKGIPIAVFKQVFGGNNPLDLDRTGDNDGILFTYNAITASNGVKVVAPNCLTCHAETLRGELVMGLGNNTADHTNNGATGFQASDFAVTLLYGTSSPEWAAYHPLSQASQAIGPYVRTVVRGVNPADKVFAALSAHRSQVDLAWLGIPQYDLPLETVPTDVPAWWLMKKKNALYYNALGRGDFARLSTAAALLTVTDTAEARRIDTHMADVMAWIRSLEPPAYPLAIDDGLVAAGKTVFETHCSKCHGTYGDTETYPNLLVGQPTVGTDPLLAESYALFPQHHTWYNDSWFAQAPHSGRLEPTQGYIAPPLDGIWATAPYLHNASVPTLADLLNSAQRPAFWKRTFDNSDFDPEKIGWRYTVENSKTDVDTYDTSVPGYGNLGHTFGDVLSASERTALLEYLKTL